jgi:16S rRNA pseudouridine516 synthase
VPERLDAFLAHAGLGSRSEVRTLVRRGWVRIDGRAVRDPATHVAGAVTLRGEPVVPPIADATLLVHKPVGLACSHDAREAPLLESLYPRELAHLALESAGRLDRATSGLLIVSTDGALIHRLTNPRRHVVKRYRIAYTGQLSARAVERVARGLVIAEDEAPTLPAILDLHGAGGATLHLREGRYHQVRRMISALGGEVVGLHRDRIGALDLPADLPAGALRPPPPDDCRPITSDDRATLAAEPPDLAVAWAALPPPLPGPGG